MVKKSRPSAKADSRQSVKDETAPTEKAEAVTVKEETAAPGEKGGIIDFYLFFSGLGILIGVIFIIFAILHYGLHVV